MKRLNADRARDIMVQFNWLEPTFLKHFTNIQHRDLKWSRRKVYRLYITINTVNQLNDDSSLVSKLET